MIHRHTVLTVVLTGACMPTPEAHEAASDLSREPVSVELLDRDAWRADCLRKSAAAVRVQGQVMDAEGSPISHAVLAVLDPATELWNPVGTTAADGSYEARIEAPAVLGIRGLSVPRGMVREEVERCVTAPSDRRGEGGGRAPTHTTDDPIQEEHFTVEPATIVHARFVDEAGSPLAGHPVWFSPHLGLWTEPTGQTTDANGQVALALPAGEEASLLLAHPTHAVRAVRLADGSEHSCQPFSNYPIPCVQARNQQLQTIEMEPGIVLEGQVIAADTGAPIVGALLQSQLGSETTRTDAHGQYRIVLPSDARQEVKVRHPEYADDSWSFPGSFLGLGPRIWPATEDITLSPIRRVQVRCAGLDDAQCQTLRLRCSDAAGEETGSSIPRSWPPQVGCLTGQDAVVSGGGVRVRVPAEEDVAWLDFRDVNGGVQGRLPEDLRCSSVSISSMDANRFDGTNLRLGQFCDDEGHFEVLGIPSGRWTVSLSYSERPWGSPRQHHETTVQIEDSVVDLGVLELSP